MTTFLVTGCAGFIGSTLSETLLSKGHIVIGVDCFNDFYDPAIKWKNIEKSRKNKNFVLITDQMKVLEFSPDYFGRRKIDCIIHLAAYPGVRSSFEKPEKYIENNVAGTLSILNFAIKFDVPSIIFASSSSVYGNCKETPFKETALVQPISVYGATKVAGESLCRAYSDAYNLNVTCLRFFTCYGPRQRPDLAIRKFAEKIIKGESIVLYGDGETSRDYTYIDDIVNGIILACTNFNNYRVINLGNNEPIKLNRLVALLGKKLGQSPKCINEPLPKGDVIQTYADISEAKRILNWKPTIPIEDGLDLFINWFGSNK